MSEFKQPTPAELKEKKIFVQYVFPDIPPKSGLRRMRYYTMLADRPGHFFLGMSYRTSVEEKVLRDMVRRKELIDLIEPKLLPYEKDVWLDNKGHVVLAPGAAPWEEKNHKVIAKPRMLNRVRILVDKSLKGKNTKVPRMQKIIEP